MLCKSVMRSVVACLHPNDSAQLAARSMRESDADLLAVCDDAGRAVGVLTARDLVRRLIADGKPSITPVKELMTRELIACRHDDDVQQAEHLMSRRRKSCVLCLDERGHLLGLIHRSDLLPRYSAPAERFIDHVGA